MRTLLRSLAVLSSLALPFSAYATTYTFTPTLVDNSSSNVTGTFGGGSGPTSFTDPTTSTYIDSLSITANTANGGFDGDELTLDFAFTAPGTGTASITGDASINGHSSNGDIDWDFSSDTIVLSDGSTVEISLPSDNTTLSSCDDRDRNCSCPDKDLCGSTDVTVTVKDNDPPVAATPEPSSLALLGTGVLGAAGMLRRKLKY